MSDLKMLMSCACACGWSTIQVITNLVKMVKARDIRRPFCPAGHWLSEEVNIRADKVPTCVTTHFRQILLMQYKHE